MPDVARMNGVWGAALRWLALAAVGLVLAVSCQIVNDTDGEFAIVSSLQPDPDLDAGGADTGPGSRGNVPPGCRSQAQGLRCAGDVPQRCAEDGSWQDAAPACEQGCTAGACNECRPRDVQCTEDGTGTRTCSVLGRWINDPPCPATTRACLRGLCLVCFPGERRCGESGIPRSCSPDGTVWLEQLPCAAGQACVPGSGLCGSCSPGDRRPCVNELGRCREGEQVCSAEATWSACSIQPGVDTCAPGNDDSCDGVPNAPSEGACTCTESAACGPPQQIGICVPGVSSCVDGQLGACTGAVDRRARNCASADDNDCNGVPDNTLDLICTCTIGEQRACGASYPPGARCRRGTQTCEASPNSLSTAWSVCEGEVRPQRRNCADSGDNDCDGAADNSHAECECDPGTTQACGSTVCSGVRTCTSLDGGSRSRWSACTTPEFAEPQPVQGLGLSGNIWGPALSRDGSTLLVSASEPQEDLFQATRPGTGRPFSVASPLSAINTAESEGTPFLSDDGLSLYFYAIRAGITGDRDLWVSTRTNSGGAFGTAAPLGGVNGAATEQKPWLSPDELTLVFDSNRSSRWGGTNTNLWTARRASRSSAFGAPAEVPGINTGATEEGATLSVDLLEIYFASDRDGGAGDLDVWVATRERPGDTFGEPRALEVVNSEAGDLDLALTADGSELFFSSSRSGLQQIYRALRSCEPAQ